MKSFLGNFYRHLAIFFCSHCLGPTFFCSALCRAQLPPPSLQRWSRSADQSLIDFVFLCFLLTAFTKSFSLSAFFSRLSPFSLSFLRNMSAGSTTPDDYYYYSFKAILIICHGSKCHPPLDKSSPSNETKHDSIFLYLTLNWRKRARLVVCQTG